MRARAPGKVVVSGAYAVLHGAPAIVSAVSRYVVADTSRPAELVTPELRAALGSGPAPWFDARELRGARGKLGLGSSAAILVAALAALELERAPALDDATLGRRVLPRALDAHRRAQGGGSGIDVAACALGGTLVARRVDGELDLRAVRLPAGLVLEVWAGGAPASTPDLVARVEALDASLLAAHLAVLGRAAERAVAALDAGSAADLIAALHEQREELGRLGDSAGAPIVTQDVARLAATALEENAVVIPSGAGGGDVALFVGRAPPSESLRELVRALGHERLELELGARGAHAADAEPTVSEMNDHVRK